MTRDTLRTEKEFIKYINEKKNYLIIREKELLTQIFSRDSYRKDALRRLADSYLDLINALYSVGNEINELREYMIRLIELVEESWKYKSFSTYNYSDILTYISLAYLLEINEENFQKLVFIRDCVKSRDNILDFIINAKLNDRKVNTRLMKWGKNKRLAKVINAKSKEEAQKLMKEDYLRYWYFSQQALYWHDRHKRNIDIYTGYWSFEAAAITKILGLDDSSYRDNKYYPKDMIKREENE
ncbi:MAG: Unknown protein [uncultured Sulfurovum sp.]|uniref:DUF1911 domain-containing protein n=1 Tax=uncultured Sulfurovum sp. TaxID=269237 RepID=A0A6S6SFG7_9BACT|nr:MAG: Unknown protein [uncultured Sulfurovum sp.]